MWPGFLAAQIVREYSLLLIFLCKIFPEKLDKARGGRRGILDSPFQSTPPARGGDHSNSAPDHEPIQGRQYSDAAYTALNNNLVRRIGTLNCGHSAYPIIMGVTPQQYSPAELEQMRQKNENGITYNGRHYTGYEATQRQRNLESAMRRQKRKILIDEAAGDAEKL